MDDTAILPGALPYHQRGRLLFEAVDQPGDTRDDRDRPLGDLHALHRPALAAKDAQDVILRRGQSEAGKKARETMREAITGAEEVQHRLLLGAGKGLALADFLMQWCHAIFLRHSLYISTIAWSTE